MCHDVEKFICSFPLGCLLFIPIVFARNFVSKVYYIRVDNVYQKKVVHQMFKKISLSFR